MWVLAAIGSAVFAGITSILAKCGIRHTDSDVATAVRTIVVLAFAWLMAGVVGSIPTITQITTNSLLFLALSGLATGASWICYFKALSMGDVNKVVPIDKCSTVLTVLLAIVLFGETQNLAVKLVGCVGILVGTLMMIERKQQDHDVQGRSWMWYAVGSAVFAALTSRFEASAKETPHELGRKLWIGLAEVVRGALVVDDGAARAVTERGASVLPVGVVETRGTYAAGDVVDVRDLAGTLLGRGAVRYSSDDMSRVRGLKLDVIARFLGEDAAQPAIHRDELLVF